MWGRGPHKSSLWGPTSPHPIIYIHSVWVPLAHNVPTIQATSPQCIIYTHSVWGHEVPTNHRCACTCPHILSFTCIRCGGTSCPQRAHNPNNVPTMYNLHTFGVGKTSPQIIVVGTHVPTSYYLHAFGVGTSCPTAYPNPNNVPTMYYLHTFGVGPLSRNVPTIQTSRFEGKALLSQS